MFVLQKYKHNRSVIISLGNTISSFSDSIEMIISSSFYSVSILQDLIVCHRLSFNTKSKYPCSLYCISTQMSFLRNISVMIFYCMILHLSHYNNFPLKVAVNNNIKSSNYLLKKKVTIQWYFTALNNFSEYLICIC